LQEALCRRGGWEILVGIVSDGRKTAEKRKLLLEVSKLQEQDLNLTVAWSSLMVGA